MSTSALLLMAVVSFSTVYAGVIPAEATEKRSYDSVETHRIHLGLARQAVGEAIDNMEFLADFLDGQTEDNTFVPVVSSDIARQAAETLTRLHDDVAREEKRACLFNSGSNCASEDAVRIARLKAAVNAGLGPGKRACLFNSGSNCASEDAVRIARLKAAVNAGLGPGKRACLFNSGSNCASEDAVRIARLKAAVNAGLGPGK